jgi:signal transduction histidine kinase
MGSETDRLCHALLGLLQGVTLRLHDLAAALEESESVRDSVNQIRQEVVRGGAMVRAAFEILGLEIAEVRRTNLRLLVKRALVEHGVTGVVLAASAWPDVSGDARLLARAVAHLARNAREATPPNGRAPELRACVRADGGVDLLVRDWGHGLAPTRLPARPFRSTRPGHEGTGLLTVERVARLHGGSVIFESCEDGTLARLSLGRAVAPIRSVRRGAAARGARRR